MNNQHRDNNLSHKGLSFPKVIIAFGVVVVISVGIALLSSIFSPDGIKNEPPETPTAIATPGLVVYGYVRDNDGKGQAGVEIFRKYASYPGMLVATTDTDGYYQTDFFYIPGDEMVTIWAEGSAMKFEPEFYYWRHYYGYQITECEFTAQQP